MKKTPQYELTNTTEGEYPYIRVNIGANRAQRRQQFKLEQNKATEDRMKLRRKTK